MTATAEQLVNVTVLHQIGLQRYSVAVIKRILSALRIVQADIEAQVRAGLPGEENQARNASSLRLTALLEQVRQTQREAHRAIRGALDVDVSDLAAAEAVFANGVARLAVGTEAALATVSADQLKAAVTSRPFQGKTLKEWTDQFEAGDARRMREQITIGYLEGESISQIAKRVKTIGKVTERGAEALVRTTVTHINARATAETAARNPHLFPKYQWVSVLDGRTTPICQSRAGQVYSNGSGPLPPAHVNCRSTTINLVRGVGPSDDLSYSKWLARQDAEDQKDILGASRYKLYRDAGLDVDRFVDNVGRSLTLEELKARDAHAFRKAGLQ